MSFFSKEISINLKPNQKLADLIELQDGHNLLVASTGAGKTTYVLTHLAKQKPVIMLCPTVSQVKQLKKDYANRDDLFFSYGGANNIEEIKKAIEAQKTIIMTFDQWSHYANTNLDFSSYTLVIDETHKLYSAGSYRDKAIQPILGTIEKKTFSQVLYLTASLTEHLFQNIDSAIVRYFHVTVPNSVQRQIQIISYKNPHILSFYEEICLRLKCNKQNGLSKIILIRINNKGNAKIIQAMLENQGYKVMLINRDEMDKKSCNDVIRNSTLDTNYQVVICTSILDEAINLNNRHDEIDSVHFIGQHAHPEEITQFIGRTRHANPPIFIHLQHNIENKRINCTKTHAQKVQRLEETYLKITGFLGELRNTLSEDNLKGLGELISSPIDHIKILNNVTHDIFQVRAFWHNGRQTKLNHSNIVAKLYQIDISNCYSNLHYLKFRLAQLLPSAKIEIHESEYQVSKSLLKEFKQTQSDLKENRDRTIPDVMTATVQIMRNHGINSYQKICEKLTDTNDLAHPYNKETQPLHHELFSETLLLGKYITNLYDVQQILQVGNTKVISSISYDYSLNPIVKAVMFGLGKYLSNAKNMGKIHTVTQVEELLNQYLQPLDNLATLKHFLNKYTFKYVELVQGNIQFRPEKVINFLKKYAHVQVLNDKKTLAEKKVKFLSIGGAFGYSYVALPKTHSSKQIEVAGKIYDASTAYERVALEFE
jgi:hypothetical protein